MTITSMRPVESAETASTAVREVQPSPPARRVVRHHARVRSGPRRCDASTEPTLHGSGLSGLTPRGRIVVAVVWLVLVALAAWPVLGRGDAGTVTKTESVRVEVGDTLWQLAQEVDPEGDPRQVVDTIMELNDLRSGGDVHPGDTLTVPVID